MAHIGKRTLNDGRIAWDVQVRVRGSPPQCKTFRSKTEAESWASLTEAAAHGRTLVIGKKLTLAHLIDEATPKIKRPVEAALRYWRTELGTMKLRDVHSGIIGRHRDLLTGAPTRAHGHKRSKPRSGSTVRSYLSCLSAVFAFGVEMRWCKSNPVRDVKLPAPSKNRTRFLSDAERKSLLKATRESETPALYPLVLMALTTGARRGELYALRWEDVDIGRRWCIFQDTKAGTPRGVPLVPAVVAELEKLPQDADVVFPESMTTAWRGAVRRAGIKNFRFHDLRHSAASRLVQSGANLSEVAQLLGHSDVRMTSKYSHIHNEHTQALVERVMRDVK